MASSAEGTITISRDEYNRLTKPRTYQQWTPTPDDKYRTPSSKFGYRTFGDIMSHAERENEAVRERNAGARVGDRDYIINPYQNYPMEGIRSLGTIVGESVKGIGFKPEWSAGNSALQWLSEKRANAREAARRAIGTPAEARLAKELAAWERWGIGEGDFDNDKDTPDNTIMFSNEQAGKIRAIDGYYLKQPKWDVKNYYNKFETKEKRQKDAAVRNEWKKYFREYKTDEEQKRHPFDEFVPKQTAFNMIKAALKSWFTKEGITTYSSKDGATPQPGELHITHYMAIWQKLGAFVYRKFLTERFGIPPTYNWEKDPSKYRGKAKQKQARDTLETMPDDHTLFKQPQQDEFKTLVQNIILQINRETINSAEEITGNFPKYTDGKAYVQHMKSIAKKENAQTEEEVRHFANVADTRGKKKARTGGVVSSSSGAMAVETP